MTRKGLVGLGVMVLMLTAVSPSWAQQDREVEGVYRCEGTIPDGTRYRGVVEIRKDADTYRVSWTMSQRASALGIGILRGDVLAVSYFTGESLGIVAKARDVKTRAELERVLGKPDDVSKLGPLEKWSYRAKNGQVVFVLMGDSVTLEATAPAEKKD